MDDEEPSQHESVEQRDVARPPRDDRWESQSKARLESDLSAVNTDSVLSRKSTHGRGIELNQPAQVRSGAAGKPKTSKGQTQAVSIPIKINSSSNTTSPYGISPQVRSSLKMESLSDSRLLRQMSSSPELSALDSRHGMPLGTSPRRSNMSTYSNCDTTQTEQKQVVAAGFPYEEKNLLGVTDLREERRPSSGSETSPPTQSGPDNPPDNQIKTGFWHPSKRPYKYASLAHSPTSHAINIVMVKSHALPAFLLACTTIRTLLLLRGSQTVFFCFFQN